MINDKPYGSLITMGLGYDASTLITSFFGLVTVTVTEVPIEVPQRGSGAGGGTVYTPYPEELRRNRRLVTITIRLGNDQVWTTERILPLEKAQLIVRAMNFVNKMALKSRIIVNSISTVLKSPIIIGNLFTRASTPPSVTAGNVVESSKTITVNFGNNDK